MKTKIIATDVAEFKLLSDTLKSITKVCTSDIISIEKDINWINIKLANVNFSTNSTIKLPKECTYIDNDQDQGYMVIYYVGIRIIIPVKDRKTTQVSFV